MVDLYILGTARLGMVGPEIDGPSPRMLALLVYAGVEQLQSVSRIAAIRLLWGSPLTSQKRHSLSQLLYKSKSATSGLILQTNTDEIQFDSGRLAVDFHALRGSLAYFDLHILDALQSTKMAENIDIRSEVFESWLAERQRELDNAISTVRRHHLRQALNTARWKEAVAISNSILAQNIYEEAAIEGKLVALAADGEMSEARRYLADTKSMFKRDLSRDLPDNICALETTVIEIDGSDGHSGQSLPPQYRFVGREDSFSKIRQFIETIGIFPMFAVTGPPGIGKSRISEQAARWAVIRGSLLIRSRGRPSQKDVPYGVLGDALEGCDEIESVVREMPHVAEALTPVLPRLLEANDRSISSSHAANGGPRLIFGAVESALNRISAGRQVLLVIDDAHWADASSLAFVDFVLRPNSRRQVKVILSARAMAGDQYRQVNELISIAAAEGQAIELPPLGRGAALALARDVMARNRIVATEADVRTCLEAAEGRPLFIVDVLKTAVFGFSGGGQHGPIAPIALEGGLISANVRQLYGRVLDGLSSQIRGVACAMAVLGGTCRVEELFGILGIPIGVIIECLDELRDAGLVRDDGRNVCFEHQLVADAVYQATGSADRAALHNATAAFLAQSANVPLSVLAFHYDRAGERADAFRNSIVSAQQLSTDHCFAEAEAQINIAARNARHDDEVREYLSLHGDILLEQSRWVDALPVLERLIDFPAGSLKKTWGLRLEVARIARRVFEDREHKGGITDELRALFERAKSDADPLAGEKIAALLLLTAHEVGAVEAVSGALEVVLDVARRSTSTASAVDLLAMGAIAAAVYEGHEAGTRIAEIGVSRCLGESDPAIKMRALLALANTQVMAGQIGRARRLFDEINDFATDPQLGRYGMELHNNNLGVALMEAGEYDQALACFHQAERSPQSPSQLYAIANQGIVHLHLGDEDGLVAAAAALKKTAGQTDAAWPPMVIDSFLGLAAVRRGDKHEATRCLNSVKSALETGGARITDSSYVYIFIARALNLLGKPDEALDVLERHGKALEGFHEPGRLRVQLERAELMRTSNPTESRRLARKIEAEAREFGLPEPAKRAAALLA